VYTTYRTGGMGGAGDGNKYNRKIKQMSSF